MQQSRTCLSKLSARVLPACRGTSQSGRDPLQPQGSKLAAFDSQPLSSLVDLELPGCEVLEKLLAEKATTLRAQSLPCPCPVLLPLQVDAFAQAWIREDAFSGTPLAWQM